jgi:hypothetical protein
VSLQFLPPVVRAGATALAVYSGLPLRSVAWSLSGPGTLVALGTHTDASGTAAARVAPVTAGDMITVTVVAGA